MEGFSDPRIMALLGASSGLLQASAPSPVPMSFAGAMGNAFPAALQGAQAAYGFQGQEMLRKRMQDEALQRIEAQEFLKNHQQQGTDPRALIKAAAISGNPQLMTMANTMQKAMPSVKTTEKVKGPDGKVYTRPIFTDGSRGDISDMEVAAPLQFQSTGKQLLGLDAYTGMPQTQYEQTTSPYQDQQLSQSDRHHANSMGMQRANYELAQRRLGLDARNAMQPKLVDGAWVYPPTQENPQGAIVPTDMFTPPKGSAAEREKGNAKVAEILGTDTEALIKRSTGSPVGAGLDAIARGLGVSTEGDNAIAKLKMRTAQLAGNVPRFEGPQSNADREYYISMVGELDNNMLPVERRLESLKELERIHKLVRPNGTVNLRGNTGSSNSDGWGDLR